MNKREKELYGKKQWKHTNPIETLNKALEDINFGKNAVLLSIGANDYVGKNRDVLKYILHIKYIKPT